MKKIIISLSFALAIIFAGSCIKDKKETVAPVNAPSNTNSTVQLKNDRLVINQEYYQSLSDSPEGPDNVIKSAKSLRFKSLRTNGPSNQCKLASKSLAEVPAFLQEIINADGIVQIGNHIMKLNFDTEKVLVLNATHENEIHDLIAENLDNKNIQVLSMEDEVLSVLANKVANTKICFRKGAPSGAKGGAINCTGYNYAFVQLKYEKYGVWFELNVDTRTGSDADVRTFKVDYYASWEKRCSGGGSKQESYSKKDNKVVLKPYSNITPLSSYYLEASVYCQQAGCDFYYGKLAY